MLGPYFEKKILGYFFLGLAKMDNDAPLMDAFDASLGVQAQSYFDELAQFKSSPVASMGSLRELKAYITEGPPGGSRQEQANLRHLRSVLGVVPWPDLLLRAALVAEADSFDRALMHWLKQRLLQLDLIEKSEAAGALSSKEYSFSPDPVPAHMSLSAKHWLKVFECAEARVHASAQVRCCLD